jgi:hypothetical protein
MAQLRTIEYTPAASSEPRSQIINRHFADLVPSGPKTGLLPFAGSAGKVSITAGHLLTADGVKITETVDLVDALTVTPNGAGFDRWDAICMVHQYQTTIGGQAAAYSIVEGSPAATPEYPAAPEHGYVLAYGLLEAGETDYARYVYPSRPLDDVRAVTVAGAHAVGVTADYNGELGFLDALAALAETGGEITLYGVLTFDQTVDIPAGVIVKGAGFSAAIRGNVDPTLRLLGFPGLGTLGDGDSTLTDAVADFTTIGPMSVVRVMIDAVERFFFIAAKSEHVLVLATPETFSGEAAIYTVMNTAQLRDLLLTNEDSGAVVEWRSTWQAGVERCFLQSDGDGLIATNEAYTPRASLMRGCVLRCGGRAVDMYQPSYCRVVDNDALGQTLRVQYYGGTCLMRGNTGDPTYELPERPPEVEGAPPVGDDTFPFNVEHEANGEHRDGAITQEHLATRVKAHYYATSGHQLAANTATRLQFNTKGFDEPDVDHEVPGVGRVTTGAAWAFTADRDMVVRVSVAAHMTDWAAALGDFLMLILSVVTGAVAAEVRQLDFKYCNYIPEQEETFLLQGDTLLSLTAGQSVFITVDNSADEAEATLAGISTQRQRSYISFEEV